MIDTIKNIVNIGFFLAIGVITVLSYLHARKTFFAPIRTETFKLQLKAFEEVLLYFQNKSEFDFMTAFDLSRIMALNTLLMADAYVKTFFSDKVKLDEEERRKNYSVFIGAVVSMEHMLKYFEIIGPRPQSARPSSEEAASKDQATALAEWQEYKYGMIQYTQQYSDQVKELDRLAASPLLPKTLRDYIGEFRSIADDDLHFIGSVITEASKQMPDHYSSPSALEEFSPAWVSYEFNHKRKKFQPTAIKILDYINQYLKVDELTK